MQVFRICFSNILSCYSLRSATDDSMGNCWLCILPESIPGSQNNCTIETPQAETAELKWDGITTTYYIPQSYEDCGLMHFATSPNNSPQKRAKSHCLNNLIPQLFWFTYSKQSFFALRFTCVLKRERLWKSFHLCDIGVSTLQWSILLAGLRRQRGSQAKPNKTTKSSFSQKEHLWSSSQAPQNLCCRICPPITCVLSEMQGSVRQIRYHSNTFWLFTRLQQLAQVTGSWQELLRKPGRTVYLSSVKKVFQENYLMTVFRQQGILKQGISIASSLKTSATLTEWRRQQPGQSRHLHSCTCILRHVRVNNFWRVKLENLYNITKHNYDNDKIPYSLSFLVWIYSIKAARNRMQVLSLKFSKHWQWQSMSLLWQEVTPISITYLILSI